MTRTIAISFLLILSLFSFPISKDVFSTGNLIKKVEIKSIIRDKFNLVLNKETQQSKDCFEIYVQGLFADMKLASKGLSYDVFKKGVIGYYNVQTKTKISEKPIISIIDFQKASTEKRLWIIDLEKKNILFHTLVAHGKNTGSNFAFNFSNKPQSNMSSLGFYKTTNTYQGKHGLSLVIEGLDKNFNTNAKARAVVIHGADYVSEDFIKCNGRLGRSQGCPALPMDLHKEIINTIQGGTTLFIHYPNTDYKSAYLNQSEATAQFIKCTR